MFGAVVNWVVVIVMCFITFNELLYSALVGKTNKYLNVVKITSELCLINRQLYSFYTRRS